MGEVRFAPGEVVFREGEPSRAVLFVRDGEVVLGTLGPGEFVGEMGVVEGRPRRLSDADLAGGPRLRPG